MENLLKRLDYVVGFFKGEQKNRRQEARLRTLRRCRIHFGEPANSTRCFITDISKSGARLRYTEAKDLPDCFDLHIEPDLKVRCKVMHRGDNELGVSFKFNTRTE